MKNKTAFTLIELVAVIVILGLLVLVAVPITTRLINDSKKTSYKNSVDNLLRTIKQNQVSEGLPEESTTYNILDNVITPEIIHDGTINGNGFVMVYQDGSTSALVNEGTFCVYKLKKHKKTYIVDTECGVGDAFTLSEGTITKHSIDVLVNYNSVIGDFSLKKELENNSNNGTWISNENNRSLLFENLTPGEDYYFYGKVLTASNELKEANARIFTENVPEPVISINPENSPTLWKYEKAFEIDFTAIEDDCIYRYRINDGGWINTRGAITTFNVVTNHALIDIQVLNAENHVIREIVDYEVVGVDPTQPIISAKDSTFAVVPESNHPVLEFFNHLENFGESGGSYNCNIIGNSLTGQSVNIQNATNTSTLPLGIDYTLTCTEMLGNGLSKTASTKIMTTRWFRQTRSFLGTEDCYCGNSSPVCPKYARFIPDGGWYTCDRYLCDSMVCDIVSAGTCCTSDRNCDVPGYHYNGSECCATCDVYSKWSSGEYVNDCSSSNTVLCTDLTK